MKKIAKDIKDANKSPYGWWVAALIERFEYENDDVSNPKRRCRAWTNTVILKAQDREEAYSKAIVYGNLGKDKSYDFINQKSNRRSRIVFEGISSLIPVYDEIDEDGTEIVFEDELVTVGKVKSWIRRKEDLEAFDDE